MKKAVISMMVLLAMAGMVLADGWTTRTPLVGTYWASGAESLASGGDTFITFHADSSEVVYGDSPGASNTAPMYVFMSMNGFEDDDSLVVYTRSTPQGSLTVKGTNASNFDLTLPGFAHGIDSLRLQNGAGDTQQLTFSILVGR